MNKFDTSVSDSDYCHTKIMVRYSLRLHSVEMQFLQLDCMHGACFLTDSSPLIQLSSIHTILYLFLGMFNMRQYSNTSALNSLGYRKVGSSLPNNKGAGSCWYSWL